MFAPSVPMVLRDFHSTNKDLGTFIVSVYLLGYAFGPLVIAPLSELYGRVPLYHANTLLFLLFNIACAKSTNFPMLIIFRFLTGLAGSCPLTIGPGSIADLFPQEERGKMMSIYTMPILFGPTLGPIVGGYISEALGWHWDFYFLVIVTTVIFIVSAILLRETYAPVLLERRAKRLRVSTGNQDLQSALKSSKTPTQLVIKSIIRPTKMIIFSPIVLCLSLYAAVVYGLLYLLFTTMTAVFEEQYGISSSNVGLTYLGLGIGQFVGVIGFGSSSDFILKRAAKGGELKPEYRLYPMLVGGIFIPVGLFWYGWTTEYKVQYMVPLVSMVFIGAGIITVFLPVGTYLVDSFPTYAASATAAGTVLRSLGGALLPLCGSRMYDTLGLGWGNSLLAFIAIALIPVTVVFIRYGERIRTHPKFQLDL
ncbi:hypothetical protein PVAG01_05316 [Phlyctema vagabunda]|uniref:Major facilitator superfamily (MFS) profile domain-containing protein n=1 Tax=Phlyctema vagabunda TaxID=108571 RepID=A0ABR4PJV3_9HELO